MSWTKLFQNFILVLLSLITGLIIVEGIYRFVPKVEVSPRFVLYEHVDGVFRNVEKFFLYEPNRTIRSVAYYSVDKQWVKEYDYKIPVNNLGLVQKSNVYKSRPSILVLGDSFTEGQGSYPWFEDFSLSMPKDLQPINGGIMGTGFRQWLMLLEYLLDKEINVSRLVVVFISDDYSRDVWSMPNNVLKCIKNYKHCEGSEGYYQMPPSDVMLGYLNKWRQNREMKSESPVREWVKTNFPASSMILMYLRNFFYTKDYESKNYAALKKLIADYGDRILFVHIPEKQEVKENSIRRIGVKARDNIVQLGATLYDGYEKCGFTNDDYMVNDGHPNSQGYKKISKCVKAAIKSKWN